MKGKTAHPFYRWAGEQAGAEGRPKWNFHKYLIGRDGEFLGWFASTTAPMGPKMRKAVEKGLGAPPHVLTLRRSRSEPRRVWMK